MKSRHTNEIDELFMSECLSLAEKGAGEVSPNPMVGAVIVRNGKVIGRGYHKKFGEAHAEVNAFRNAASSVKGATLYVNVEPCNYFGKTPPCTDLIIEKEIARVVVGMKDPNPKVSGKGIRQLRRAGMRVDAGVLEDECEKLNESFVKFMTRGLPFVTLKVAQTLDGKIADARGHSKWITNELSRTVVHHLRSRYDAVLVGSHTVASDNPQLTVRLTKGRNPKRIVVSRTFDINPQSNLFTDGNETIVIADPQFIQKNGRKRGILLRKGVQIVKISSNRRKIFSVRQILKALAKLGIASVLVEGGAATFSAFLKQNMADKLLLFVSPKVFGKGLGAFDEMNNGALGEEMKLRNISTWKLGDDILIEAYVQ